MRFGWSDPIEIFLSTVKVNQKVLTAGAQQLSLLRTVTSFRG